MSTLRINVQSYVDKDSMMDKRIKHFQDELKFINLEYEEEKIKNKKEIDKCVKQSNKAKISIEN